MGSTGKSTNNGTILKPDGTVVQIPAGLVYSPDTGSLPISQRVLDFEKKHGDDKIEHLILWNDLFGELGQHTGDEKHVSAPIYEHQMAEITSHNHPRVGDEKGWLSGTFSPQDITVFADYHQTDRVVGYEGIYSISKGVNFDKSLAQDYKAYCDQRKQKNVAPVQDIQNRLNAEYTQLKKDFAKKTEGMSYTQFEQAYKGFAKDWDAINRKYEAEVDKLANQAVVENHNWLLANQKKYGYTYGLTRR